MKYRYKIIINAEIEDPSKPYPAGGEYTGLNRLEGVKKAITHSIHWIGEDKVRITIDKVIPKGVV